MTPLEFSDLFTQYESDFRRYAERLAGPDADDLVQEAALKAFRFRHHFVPNSNFASWFIVVLRNLHYSDCRKNAQMRLVDLDEIRLRRAPELPMEGLSDEVIQALSGLKQWEREAVLLADIEQMPHEEIAAITGAKSITIRTRLTRGRNKLARLLRGYGEAHGYVSTGERRTFMRKSSRMGYSK